MNDITNKSDKINIMPWDNIQSLNGIDSYNSDLNYLWNNFKSDHQDDTPVEDPSTMTEYYDRPNSI